MEILHGSHKNVPYSGHPAVRSRGHQHGDPSPVIDRNGQSNGLTDRELTVTVRPTFAQHRGITYCTGEDCKIRAGQTPSCGQSGPYLDDNSQDTGDEKDIRCDDDHRTVIIGREVREGSIGWSLCRRARHAGGLY